MTYMGTLHAKKQMPRASYTKEELERLTTLQLREICSRENIAVGRAFNLDRGHISSLILKHRGLRVLSRIKIFDSNNFEQLVTKFSNYFKHDIQPANHQIPTRMTFYKGLDTTPADRYMVKGWSLFEGHALLLDNENQILGILFIEQTQGGFYITCKGEFLHSSLEPRLYKNCKIGFLSERGSKFLCKYYNEGGHPHPTRVECFIKPIQELHIVNPPILDNALVIDFGTSNTSAGTWLYSDKISPVIAEDIRKNGLILDLLNKVKFPLEEILPTAVRIKDCSESGKDKIQFQFGHEALSENIRRGYTDKATLFYCMKKWVNNYNKQEEVFDESGNYASIARSDILRAYLIHIIKTAEQQHKCRYKNLHITSPVKQKQQFLQMYKDILPEYNIEVESALDEGVAVLYNVVSGQIERKKFKDGERYRAMVIDCGGGTTDFTTCEYTIEYKNHTHELEMTTTYANGESNFGGNNITFRIFQYLKIIFSQYYGGLTLTTVEALISAHKMDIYRKVDDDGRQTVYAGLEAAYKNAEKLIPTQFYNYMHTSQDEYLCVRHNFYFLWNLAEKVKIEFFKSANTLQTTFHDIGLKRNPGDPKIIAEESWRIYIDTAGMLVPKTDYPKVVISKNEVDLLISADIYHIVNRFIEPLYKSRKINQYNAIRLTGQSCKIELFRDALKEFIPGRQIAFPNSDNAVLDLKLTCLEGAVKHQNARGIGDVKPNIKQGVAFAPFRLTYISHANEEKTLISGLERVNVIYGFVPRSIDTERVELTLTNGDGIVLRSYVLNTCISKFKPTSYHEMFANKSEHESKIFQRDIDEIVDGEMRVFAYSFKDVWGFYTLPVARKNGVLLMGEQEYLPFEDDEGEQNFFEGKI